jgi:hypothetical protein
MATLARLTNIVQRAMASGKYAGAIWLEGSPSVEETAYWLNLLIDASVPIVGNASQRPHGAVSNDGDRNIIDSVDYLVSRIWADEAGRDRVGGVVIQDEQIFTARDVQKADARPGGYVATGGHGGVVGTIGAPGPPALTFVPARRHTWTSALSTKHLPDAVEGVRRGAGRLESVAVQIKDAQGELLSTAIPKVTIVKSGNYLSDDFSGDPTHEVAITAQVEKNLRDAPLAGFIGEGTAPFGRMNTALDAALRRAALSGMPVVKVGRGNAEGFTQPQDLTIGGNNLTATKARLLLMACLLKLGGLPPAADADHPTQAELRAIQTRLAEYQALFDTH